METWLFISSISSSTHFSRGWGVGLKVQTFSSWLRLSGDGPLILKLSRCLPRVASLEQMTLLSPGNTRGLRNSVLGTRVKDQKLEQKILLATPSLRKVQVFKNHCDWNQGQRLSIKQDVFLEPHHSGNNKGFRSSVSGLRGRNQIFIYYVRVQPLVSGSGLRLWTPYSQMIIVVKRYWHITRISVINN